MYCILKPSDRGSNFELLTDVGDGNRQDRTDRQSLWRVRSDCLGEEDGDYADADTARTSNANHYQRGGSTLPPDCLVHLPRGCRH